jgi:preprotein translocase subunit SecE
MATGKSQEGGFLSKVKRPFLNVAKFLREVGNELQRVVWPSHDETYGFTVVVIIAVVVVAAWVGVWDLVFGRLVGFLTGGG